MSHPEILPELIENGRQILAACARIQDTTGLADEFPLEERINSRINSRRRTIRAWPETRFTMSKQLSSFPCGSMRMHKQ